MRAVAVSLALLAAAILVPTPTSAQEGAIAGRVIDAVGSLPGVTVEVLGSAQRETRLEVTDLEGRYRIDDLPPGAYAVWFRLPGFHLVVRDSVVVVGAGLVTMADAEMVIFSLADDVGGVRWRLLRHPGGPISGGKRRLMKPNSKSAPVLSNGT